MPPRSGELINSANSIRFSHCACMRMSLFRLASAVTEEIVPALVEFGLVNRLGKTIGHHVVSTGEKDLHPVAEVQLSCEVKPSVEMYGTFE